MAHLITDELWFKAVVKLRRQADSPPFNAYLWDAFVTGYGVKQSLGIRRLTEAKDGTASLLQIVRKVKANAHLLTREIVVGYSGASMNTGDLFQEVWQEARRFGEDSNERAEASQKWYLACDAHDAFDRLRDRPLNADRLANDKIADAVLERLDAALTSEAIKRVRHRCDKYLAHADLSDLSAGPDGPTYNDITHSIQTLVEVKQFLTAEFFVASSSAVVPIYQAKQFEHLSAPLVPPMPSGAYRMAWDALEAEVEAWGGIAQYRRYAVHPES